MYKQGKSPLMNAEVLLMAVEVMYLWRALPCCPTSTKEELLGRMEGVWSHDCHMTDCHTRLPPQPCRCLMQSPFTLL